MPVGGEESQEASPRGVLEIRPLASSSDNTCCSCSIPTPPDTLVCHHARRRKDPHLSSGWKKYVGDVLGKKPASASSSRDSGSGVLLRVKDVNKVFARIQTADSDVDERIGKCSWRSFDYAELAAATGNFSPDNLIGKGGHALVYKGCLKDGQSVAVKKLKRKDGEDGHGDQHDRAGAFLSELGIIVHVDHPNAVRLIGFSTDNGLFFVLEMCPRGSLASLLHGSSSSERVLEWKVRFKVAVRVAMGMQYLHHNCRRRIIHRDIKPSNILLAEDYEPQISDFGLAKWLPEKWIHHVIFPVEGTIGYLAPEYFMHGIANEKTDVFAFGVVLLELITGRRAVDSLRESLVMWAQPLLKEGNIKGLADPRLGEEYDPREMRRAVLTASMCTHHISTSRPDMNQVVELLTSLDDRTEEWKHESVSKTAFILSACDSEEGYDCTDYLQDFNRHMQLLMES
ncbi:hypothetical protein MLD38_008081 [Melastoma candidum]|uniref:Uncharacterized protein n=1 Tax=Melastoma candidum TaxID=119954 RepID=A0ACB9RTC7_9MYRT|nr:hypothetical protein MLD38_008081 [Melastoma candidum]